MLHCCYTQYQLKCVYTARQAKQASKRASKQQKISVCCRYYVKNADTMLASGCDSQCLKDKLCYTATARMGDSAQCDKLLQKYEDTNESGDHSGFINTVSGYMKPLING
jgi:hypothetical protein